MIFTSVTFGSPRKGDPARLKEIAESYLATLLHSGQLCGDYFLAWKSGRLTAWVQLAGPGATEPRHHSLSGKKELKNVTAAFGRKPEWCVLDDATPQRATSWKRAPFLYLFTTAVDRSSPVCCGDRKPPVPVFRLPLTFAQKDALYGWQQTYYHLDNIWLGSDALEIPAYRQLADPASELAGQGRALCREIESATAVPVFYYLMKHWGRSKGEEARLCPGCGGNWRTEWPPDSPRRFADFDFKCDRCRLVSHCGVSTHGGRHTRIGEFTETRIPQGCQPVAGG